MPGTVLVDDVHGLMTFEDEPWPTFCAVGGLSFQPAARYNLSSMQLRGRLRSPEVGLTTDKEETAFDLYAASFFVSIDDARSTMLIMALETLMEPKPRSTQARNVSTS